ncbi:L,D-transpeptidase [Streptomyces sp. URMC 123]|uniref:L,D-transpeptidase n=1 Tax=Streptomyces sp. URMC 123 TaxID=3423403 RepID=UPI003F1DE46D
MARRWAVGALAALTLALTGCQVADLGLGGAPRPPEEAIRVLPADGATGVRPDARLEVSVPDGRLERVRVARAGDGERDPVAGRIGADGLTWRPAPGHELAAGSRYTVAAVALDGHGRRSARHTTFTTAAPRQRLIGFFRPEHGSTVGTGMIVSFDFNRAVTRRAAVERAIRVTADPPVEIAAHWFGPRRLDFRPRHYWRPGTRVTVRLRLRDVKGAPGAYGSQHKTVRFTVGRDRSALVDAARHTLTVRRDGRPVATLPITAGAPESSTYNGKMVVMERYEMTRMNGNTVGFGGEYDIPDVPHALRLTRSGTFLHGNYWAPEDTFGTANTSHGCIGLRDVRGGSVTTPAGWFWADTLVGDVVEVVGSDDRVVAPDNGLGGWNMDWRAWRAGSALSSG